MGGANRTNYDLAMQTVATAMKSGAEPSATECAIEQYVNSLEAEIEALKRKLDQ